MNIGTYFKNNNGEEWLTPKFNMLNMNFERNYWLTQDTLESLEEKGYFSEFAENRCMVEGIRSRDMRWEGLDTNYDRVGSLGGELLSQFARSREPAMGQ